MNPFWHKVLEWIFVAIVIFACAYTSTEWN
jgi:hypothetical protein